MKKNVVKTVVTLSGILLLCGVIIAVGFSVLRRGNMGGIAEVKAETQTVQEESAAEGELTQEAVMEKEKEEDLDLFEVDGITFYEKMTPDRPAEGEITREEAAAIVAAEWRRLFPEAVYGEPVGILYGVLQPVSLSDTKGLKNMWAIEVKDGWNESRVDAVTGEIKTLSCPYKISNYGYQVTEHGYSMVGDDPWINTQDFYRIREEQPWIQLASDIVGSKGLNPAELVLKDPEVEFSRTGRVYVTFTLGPGEEAEAIEVVLYLKTREFMGYSKYAAGYREELE